MLPITPPIRWGILATGRIAGIFTRALAAVPASGSTLAVGSRSLESARRFASQHGIGKCYGTYEELLLDPELQAIYVATPHVDHRRWAIAAIEAGKHVLCEKPAGINRAEAQAIVDAARAHGVLFMEAFMYRCHPQTRKVCEIIESGLLGPVGLVQAAFGFNRPSDPKQRLWNRELGGGGILDVGCYPVSWSRLIAGCGERKPFADPVEVSGTAHLHAELGVDVYAAATLRFAGGMIAQVSCGIGLSQENVLRIYGQTGWLEISSPYVCEYDGRPVKIVLNRPGQPSEDLSVPIERDLYTYEVEAFAEALSRGQSECAAMSHADTLGNLATIDAWRAAAGLRYSGE